MPNTFFQLDGAFSKYTDFGKDDHVGVDQNNSLAKTGERSNIFTRFANFVRREPKEEAQMRKTASDFVDSIREAYGKEAGDAVAKKLKTHTEKGRPLSGERMQKCVLLARKTFVYTFSPAELRLARREGMTLHDLREFYRAQVPIHPRMLPKQLHDGTTTTEPKPFGKKTTSDVLDVSFQRTDKPDMRTAFKGADTGSNGLSWASWQSGVRPEDGHVASRSIATKMMDELLGFDLVPETQVARVGGKLGVAMEVVPGVGVHTVKYKELVGEDAESLLKYAQKPGKLESLEKQNYKFEFDEKGKPVRVWQGEETAFDLNYQDPDLRKGLVRLQLLDALCGQVDRHGNNYLVSRDSGGKLTGLKAIDNDQAFGVKLKHPDDCASSGPINKQSHFKAFRGVQLPKVVDREMVESFRNIKPDDIRRQLAGVLPKEEIEATVSRLKAIQKHLTKLEKAGMVIEPGDWGKEKATEALSDRNHSYVGRDQRYSGLKDALPYPLPKTEDGSSSSEDLSL